MDRRTLVGVAAAAMTSSASAATPKAATSKTASSTHQGFEGDFEPRGTTGRLERLPTLELESQLSSGKFLNLPYRPESLASCP